MTNSAIDLGRLLTSLPAEDVWDVQLVGERELRCAVRASALPALATHLRTHASAEIVFMAGADRRRDRGVFQVHYLFKPEREAWSLLATADVDGATPVIPSLATFHYPASRAKG
jgi:Ni,Fe-hydrogenase III component G